MNLREGMMTKQVSIPRSIKIVHVINIFGDHFESFSLFIATDYLVHLATLGSKVNLIEETNRDVVRM